MSTQIAALPVSHRCAQCLRRHGALLNADQHWFCNRKCRMEYAQAQQLKHQPKALIYSELDIGAGVGVKAGLIQRKQINLSRDYLSELEQHAHKLRAHMPIKPAPISAGALSPINVEVVKFRASLNQNRMMFYVFDNPFFVEESEIAVRVASLAVECARLGAGAVALFNMQVRDQLSEHIESFQKIQAHMKQWIAQKAERFAKASEESVSGSAAPATLDLRYPLITQQDLQRVQLLIVGLNREIDVYQEHIDQRQALSEAKAKAAGKVPVLKAKKRTAPQTLEQYMSTLEEFNQLLQARPALEKQLMDLSVLHQQTFERSNNEVTPLVISQKAEIHKLTEALELHDQKIDSKTALLSVLREEYQRLTGKTPAAAAAAAAV